MALVSEKILVIDRGDIEFAYPGEWDVQFDPTNRVERLAWKGVTTEAGTKLLSRRP
ncbi:MAG: hypothetical protein HYS05_05125 [Acidobacteria bacterium]|nr:hypothetical protein [Acidobacteriota bacterium]